MGFNSGFKGLINVLYVNKQEFSASSWRSNQGSIRRSSGRLYVKELRIQQFLSNVCMCRVKIHYYQLKLVKMFTTCISYKCCAYLDNTVSFIVIIISTSYFYLHSKAVIPVFSVDVYTIGGLLHTATGTKHARGTS